MFPRVCLAVLMLGMPLLAAVTLEQIRSKPPSNARNFLIWQYFDQNITSEEADKAFYLIRGVNYKMFFAYAAKSDRPEVAYTVRCMKMGSAALGKSNDPACAKLAASVGKLSYMPVADRDRIADLVGDPGLRHAVTLLDDTNLSKHYRRYAPKLFLRVFNRVGTQARRMRFDFIPDYDYLQRLAESPGFTAAVKRAINDKGLQRFAWALTRVEGKTLDAETLFYLGLNQLIRGKKARAIELFQLSGDKAYYQDDKDRALFWQALAGGNDLTWKLLAKSWDINFYSLYAKEKTGSFPDNYYSQVQTSQTVSDINLSDPFVWHDLLEQIRRTPKPQLYTLAQRYDAKNLTPLQSFIVERASGYRLQGFIMPYEKELNATDTDTKAIVYALMRQESRFIPAALSRSFAMGLMQMMPFLCVALDDDVDCGRQTFDDMFDPRINLLYALPHIAWLKQRVYHPLFIAYAYNGGIGFTKRHLQNGSFRPGKYEPFLSMELMLNGETREYGKKVLTNYVVYKKILGESVSLIDLCRTLLRPSKTDRFRSAK
jgi:soluble lytic murein transglycosylase